MTHSALAVDIETSRGTFTLQVAHTFPAGQVTAVVGKNGSGKSTLVQAIAGFCPVQGRITRGEQVLSDSLGSPKVLVSPDRRSTVLLGQDPHLFPNMTALDNVAFGLRAQGVAAADARESGLDWLSRLGLESLAQRRPAQLSGGQRQRVALARALAAKPQTLLLDEPTAALDVDAAAQFRALLQEVLAKNPVTTIIVSHSAQDILGTAAEVVVLEEGRVIESGPALEHLVRPRQEFTAALAGMNRVEGTWNGQVFLAASSAMSAGSVSVALSGGRSQPLSPGPALCAFPIDAVTLLADGDVGDDVQGADSVGRGPALGSSAEGTQPAGLAVNRWGALVEKVEAHPRGFAVHLSRPESVIAHVDLLSFERSPVVVGQRVTAQIAAGKVSIYR